MEWWKNWAAPRVLCDLAPSWLLNNCYTNREDSTWKKKSPQPWLLSHVFFWSRLIFSFLRGVPSRCLRRCTGPYQNMYVCWALALISNNKHKSDLERKRLSHLCLPLFMSRQQGGFSLKYQHAKPKEAVDVFPAIISSSLHDIICCFDLYNKPTRGTQQEVRAAPGVAR